jgi:hypothetical protein
LELRPEHRVSQRLAAIAALLIGLVPGAAPLSAQTASPQAQAQSETAVQSLMQAVADSNLDKMAELWGTSKGPASQTHQPTDYGRRLFIMQAYLRGAGYRILSNSRDGNNDNRRVLQVEMTRNGCTKIVPFTTIRAGQRWLVEAVDLDALGGPGRRCGEGDSTSGS